MKIIQMIETLTTGDGMGNHTLRTHEILKEAGYDVITYSLNSAIPFSDDFRIYTDDIKISHEDIILLQFGIFGPLAKKIQSFPCRKILVYHNVTPPHFFAGYDMRSYKLTKEAEKIVDIWGRQDFFDEVLTFTRYNKECLLNAGFSDNRITVFDGYLMPYLVDHSCSFLKEKHDINDRVTNVLFTGRITPNKRQTDVLEAFAYYQKHFNPSSRLIIAGSGLDTKYGKEVKQYAEGLHCKNICFTGFIKDEELQAYYNEADIFLCMSEHEGFCIPLVEAMKNNIPIIAYSAGAIPDTLGNAGVLLKEKNPVLTAMWMNEITVNKKIREELINSGQKRMRDFDQELAKKNMLLFIQHFIEKKVMNYKVQKEDGKIYEVPLEKQFNAKLYDYLSEKFQELNMSMPIDRKTYVDTMNGEGSN